jgi:cell wall-associated NlpC family hydrolase
MTQNKIARKWFIKTALSYLGTPYIWGGDDPSGFDCSGFVIECLRSVGMLTEKEDYTADGLYRLYKNKVVKYPYKSNLIFYLDDKHNAYHVAICLDKNFQIGALGGNSANLNSQNAWDKNAFVKIRPIKKDQSNFKFIDIFN